MGSKKGTHVVWRHIQVRLQLRCCLIHFMIQPSYSAHPGPTAQQDPHTQASLLWSFCSHCSVLWALVSCPATCWSAFSPPTPQELPLQLSPHEPSRLPHISMVSLPFGLSHIGGLAFGLNAHPSFRPSLTFPHSLVSWPTGHGFCILTLVTGKVWGREGDEGSPTATIRNLITDQPWLPSFIR